MEKVTAKEFRKRYARTGDKRTKKKTQAKKYKGESKPGYTKLVCFEIEDTLHCVPETNTDMIEYYKKKPEETSQQ